MNNEETNSSNSEFWDEMCGTNIAKVLGIQDDSSDSLQKFDQWFFAFYPYLDFHLKSIIETQGKVLEVGLGYGSVATLLLSQGVEYHGLDIASGPVQMANNRATQLRCSRTVAQIGNVLDLSSFNEGGFDAVVAIGSLHHTGDFDLAVKELSTILKPDGITVGMVYSLFSVRNWIMRPRLLFSELLKNFRGTGSRVRADENLRWMSDHNSDGVAAPATEYFSRRALRSVLSQYGSVRIKARNLDALPIVGGRYPKIRILMMRSPLPHILGLDLYFEVTKKQALV